MAYILSIIIPTKNRYEYLKECLLTLSSLNQEEVEIIVQDNSDDNQSFLDFLEKSSFKNNIKYFYSGKALSQTENSDFALKHANGEYCCYIGDDDSVSSKIVDVVRYLKKNNYDACVCDVSTFHWSDVVFEKKPKPSFSCKTVRARIKKINIKKVLKSFFSWGAQDIKYLPRVYHGVIAKRILNQILETTGSYFPGPSPDMANAVASTLLVKDCIYINAPLIVSGYSYKSAGGLGLRGGHKGDLKNVKQLPSNAEKEWSPRIPKVWLGYTVWPESAEKALIRMGHQELCSRINFVAMEAKIYLKYSEYRKMVKKRVNTFSHFVVFVYELFRFGLRWMWERLCLSLRKLFSKQFYTFDSFTLLDAVNKTNQINNKILKEI